MVRQERLEAAHARAGEPIRFDAGVPPPIAEEAECLEEILEAFRDIADRDDIHQAAARLERVQAWIRRTAELAAADPIFAGLRLLAS
jgi:hypothetical protein